MSNINPYDCVKFELKGDNIHAEVDYYKYMECLRTDNSKYLKNESNKRRFYESVFDDSKEAVKFKGGKYEELFTDRSIEQYEQFKKDLKNNEFFRKIQEKLMKQNKRRRVFTDKDGDFDYDRRFDIAPYSSVIKQKVNKKVVDFNIHTGFSWNVDEKIINKYAAIVCVLNDIFNTFGVSTNIYNIKNTLNITNSGTYFSGNPPHLIAKIKIKDSNTYSTTQTILKNIDSIFYRRALFGLTVLASDYVDKTVDEGLGQPKRYEKNFEFKHGEINIYSGFHADEHMNDFFKQLYENI